MPISNGYMVGRENDLNQTFAQQPLDSGAVNPAVPVQPLPATALPTGAMPTIPPGGIAPYPVQYPAPTGTAQPPVPQQPVSLASLNLPSVNGQQFVAQANGTNQTSPAIPTANWQQPTGATSAPWNGVSPVQPIAGGVFADPAQSGQRVQTYLDDLLNSGNPYLTNAARRGLETANARGMMNSSVAAGASTRSAIEAAQPILNEIMGLNNAREGMQFTSGENAADRNLQAGLQAQNLNFEGEQNKMQRDLTATLQREGWGFEAAQAEAQRQTQVMMDRENRAFSGEQNALDRTQGVNNALLGSELNLRNLQAQSFYNQQNAQQDYDFRRAMQSDSVAQQDWLSNQNFSREFNAGIAMLPIQNASQLHNAMMQAALEQPEVYTPEVLSGFSNFFNNQFLAQMQMYFPENTGGTP